MAEPPRKPPPSALPSHSPIGERYLPASAAEKTAPPGSSPPPIDPLRGGYNPANPTLPPPPPETAGSALRAYGYRTGGTAPVPAGDLPASGDIRDTLATMGIEPDTLPPPPSSPHNPGGSANTSDLAVFGFCELWGLVLGFPPGEDLYHGQPFTVRMGVFFAAASMFVIAGPMWPRMKSRLPRRLAVSIARTASSFPLWLASLAVLLAFAYGPDIYQRAMRPLPQAVVTPLPAPPLPSSPSLKSLSDDEKQLRHDLRIFVLSDIEEQVNAFAQMALPMVNNSTNPNASARAAGVLFEPLYRSQYLETAWTNLENDAENKTIESMDVSRISADLKAYFAAYVKAQSYFKAFLVLSGQDPNKDALARFTDANARVSRAFDNLRTSPAASQAGIRP